MIFSAHLFNLGKLGLFNLVVKGDLVHELLSVDVKFVLHAICVEALHVLKSIKQLGNRVQSDSGRHQAFTMSDFIEALRTLHSRIESCREGGLNVGAFTFDILKAENYII